MSVYKNILVSVDLGPQSLYICKRAAEIAQEFESKLNILHIIEPPMIYTADFAEHKAKIKESNELAEKSLSALSDTIEYDPTDILIAMGSPQSQVLSTALEQKCDLILLGSHGVGGYTHLLGSTAHHVISHAHCDTLIIQVTHLQEKIKESPSKKYLWETQPDLPPVQAESRKFEGPKHGGSLHGYGEEVFRGPRLLKRPFKTPYRGGTRHERPTKPTDEDEK